MLAVFAIPEEKLFVQCSECDGFVSLVRLSILIMKMLCVLSVIKTVWSDTGVSRRWVSLLIMAHVTAVPISSTMEVNVDDW